MSITTGAKSDWLSEMKARHRAGYRLVPDARQGCIWSKKVGPLTWRLIRPGAYSEEAGR